MESRTAPSRGADESAASGLFALLVGIAAVVGVGGWMLRAPPPPAEEPQRPPFVVPVSIVAVELGDVVEQVELVGDVLAPERARVAFERPGRLRELAIRLGQVVRSGDVLARLDDEVMEQQVRASAAALDQARAMSDLAQRDVKRLKELRDVGVAAAVLDRAESVARNEGARVRQLEADLALEQARLAQGVLTAPFDAQVTARPAALGDYVAAGDLCCELLPLDEREIVLELPAALVGALAPGAPLLLTSDALPGLRVATKLASLLPATDPRGRTFRAVAWVGVKEDPDRKLQPGMFVRARVERRAARQARVVPVDALLERPDAVLLVRYDRGADGKPGSGVLVPVAILARDADRAAIAPLAEARLEAGDSIVLTGKENVYPGALVQAVDGP
ncbi:MAG: efflux RND transporter periplasmic adaptor subunit [Planctomycetes bacterium]|nr:efflux RND transporter periplasmic adaptor subunit [Planctomycetota bacterium]